MVLNSYLCEHDREGVELVTRDDELLPPKYQRRECPVCGAAAEWDTELDEFTHT